MSALHRMSIMLLARIGLAYGLVVFAISLLFERFKVPRPQITEKAVSFSYLHQSCWMLSAHTPQQIMLRAAHKEHLDTMQSAQWRPLICLQLDWCIGGVIWSI